VWTPPKLTPPLVVIYELPKHAHAAGITGMVQGVVRLACLQAGAPYALMIPSNLKKFSTGSGTASKPDMRMEWYKRTGEDIRDDNQVDAIWLRQAGMHALRRPEAVQLPKINRESLLKVQWPPEIARILLEPYEQVIKDTVV
jgi:hypothetical protein